MKKKIFTLMIISVSCLNGFSQTIKENIDKAAKDKSNADRAAKADVLIHKKIITDDSTKVIITSTKVVSKPIVKTKKKYKATKQKKNLKTSK